jgi:ATP-binding cassette, subfamily G (WHITE), member 2
VVDTLQRTTAMSATAELDTDDIALGFKDITVSNLMPPEPFVSNVSGFIQAGCITAIFGASASGKSLLLKALSGRVGNLSVNGDVLLNGVKVDPANTMNSISYVSQGNMLLGDLTAREMLTQSANLKLTCSKEKIKERVETVLKDLGIDHVADSYIGTMFRAGLSGGQQRRVDAGIELVATPSVLLMDEPTT